MTSAEWFVTAIVALEVGAALCYLWQDRYLDMVIWLGVAASNVAWICKVIGER